MANKEQKEPMAVEEALNTSEQFLAKYQKPILYGLAAVVIVVMAIIAYHNLYLVPKNTEAANAMYSAQNYFAADSFRVALEGDGIECIGFAGIADEYKITKSGKLAKAYAGICAYKLGRYDEAADYLGSYKGKDMNIAPAAKQLLGDTYVELGDTKKAIKTFEAVAAMKHDIFSPMSLKKAGIAYESIGENAKAVKAYRQIKEDYPNSTEAQDIDKYIAALQ